MPLSRLPVRERSSANPRNDYPESNKSPCRSVPSVANGPQKQNHSPRPRNSRKTFSTRKSHPFPAPQRPIVPDPVLPVSACSFTQSCRGCLQSKPAGEVIDSWYCLSFAPPWAKVEKSCCKLHTPVLRGRPTLVPPAQGEGSALVHKTAHPDIHHHAQRQKREQHGRTAVTH